MRRRLVLCALISTAIALPALVGCGGGDDVTVATPAVVQLDGSAVDVDDFASVVDRDNTVVLDVRTAEEFAAGHLPDAVLIDVQEPDFAARIAELDPGATYAVYCRSGNRSAVAVQMMQAAGFDDVVHLDGGIGAWAEAGRLITTG